MSFTSRRSVLESAYEWTVTPDGLLRRELTEQPKPAELLPWEWFTEMRLRDRRSGQRGNLYECALRLVDGRELVIPSESYVSIATFDDRAAGYLAFVTELHAVLPERAPQCRFRRGNSAPMQALQALILLTALGGVAFIGWILWTSEAGSWSSLLALLLLLPVAFGQFRANRGGTYDPHQPPPEVLPSA